MWCQLGKSNGVYTLRVDSFVDREQEFMDDISGGLRRAMQPSSLVRRTTLDDNDMNRQPAQAPPEILLEEYAAELTPAPGELAATLGPAERRPAAAEPRKAAGGGPPPRRNLEWSCASR